MDPAAGEAIEIHQASGNRFEAGGVTSFVREAGSGSPVVLLHGVPVSSFLYRKLIPELAEQGVRPVAFDFPGLGLAERPADFDYSIEGLARWTGSALDALEIERAHLVVHDFGGPIGCSWAAAEPGRVLSLTILNSPLGAATYRPPWTMRPFSVRGLGEAWLRGPRSVFVRLFYLQGIADPSAVPVGEVLAHYELLRRNDRGRAFLRIMRAFDLNAEREATFRRALGDRPYPARVVWGERDPAIKLDQMRAACEIAGVDDPLLLPAKHFLQEDHAPEVAAAIADVAAPLG